MAMASSEEDEFGNLYADVHIEDVNALRGCGSVYWSYEDESDASAGRAPSAKAHRQCLLGAMTTQSYADATKEQCHPSAAGVQNKFHASGHLLDAEGMGEEERATFMHAGTSVACNRVSSAEYASKQNHLTEIAKSKHCLRNAGGTVLGAEDIDTESDDDLHIVLNPLQGVINEGSGEDSEDGEDFVILAGNEAANDREWQEESFKPIEDKAHALLGEGEKLGTLGDEKGQSWKSPGVHPRVGYGGHVYHRHYRYVRESGPLRVGANSSVNARVANCKSGHGKADRLGGGRGFMNSQRVALPSRGTGALRGFSCGLEYSIPSNKTVFDVDMDALKEKPWRLPHVDVSDYFNFGLDEIGWTNYCKQLAQFCSEIATQSKISVYEGGRAGQSTTHAIQAGGGACERRSSADGQGQQIRESDAIFLIDVREDNSSQSCSEGHLADAGEVNKFLHIGSPEHDLALRCETSVQKKVQSLAEKARRASDKRKGAILQECLGNEIKDNEDAAVIPREGLVPPSASRPKTPSPSTPPERIPMQEKRETERGKSWSSSLNEGSQIAQEDYVFGTCHRVDVERKGNLQHSDSAEACRGRNLSAALRFCEDNHLSGKLDMKWGSSHAIAAHLSKKRRLGLRKVNHNSQCSSQVVKKLSSVNNSPAMLGAYKANVGAKSMHQDKHSIRNNTVEYSKGEESARNYVNGSDEQHAVEKAGIQKKSLSHKMESKKLKGKGKSDSSKVRDLLGGMPREFAEEKSKENLKFKKCRKGHKRKEKTKSKVKVHLPGCPNLEKRQLKGFDKSLLNQKQGTGDMSMISFVSKDNCFFWKKVESMCLRDIQDQDAEKINVIWQCHETEQRTQERGMIHTGDSQTLGHVEIGGDKEIKKRNSRPPKKISSDGKYAGTRRDNHSLKRKVVNSWKALRVLSGKKEEVRHMLLGEMGLASSKTGSLADSTCEAHVRDSMQVAFDKQMSTREKRKHGQLESDDKSQGLTYFALSSGQRRKKHCSKKSRKPSCRESNHPTIACPAAQPKQESDTLTLMLVKGTELMINKNDGSSTLIDGRVSSSDHNDKNKKSDSEHQQLEIHPTKACNSKLPSVSTDTLNGNGYIGFDISRLQENQPETKSLFVEQVSANATLSESSQEENKKRGRSKFERWTSHSEQARNDSCFSLSDMQIDGRISLSRKATASKFGQCLRRQDGSALQPTKGGDNCAGKSLQPGTGKKWKIPRKHKEKMKAAFNEEADNESSRGNEQQNVKQNLDQFVAKLEKRRERFKLAMVEEREPLQRTAIKDLPLTDRVDVKLGRPARKRCWGGG
eukprot:c18349_g1_i1 orf=469-4380(-)